jgi:anti-anti-sigma regulatory factor
MDWFTYVLSGVKNHDDGHTGRRSFIRRRAGSLDSAIKGRSMSSAAWYAPLVSSRVDAADMSRLTGRPLGSDDAERPRTDRRRARLVRLRNRSRRLTTKRPGRDRSRGTAPPPEVRGPLQTAGLVIHVAQWRDVIRIDLSGDLSGANATRLSDCLEHALETRAQRVILDLSGLDRLEPKAVSPILIAQMIADSEHRQLLLIPGSDSVQRILDRVQGPFSYVDPRDESLLADELNRRGDFSAGRRRKRPRRRIVDLLVGRTDDLIAASDHASEPIGTFEYAGASALLGALELWLLIEDRAERARRR